MNLAANKFYSTRRTPENPFWANMSAEYIITELMAIPIGAGIGQIRADMEQIINGLQEYQRVFTDRSLSRNKVGCAIVMTQTNIKIRQNRQHYLMLNSRLYWRLLNLN
jgi:hypothetical protein